jgi:hypothetical protein
MHELRQNLVHLEAGVLCKTLELCPYQSHLKQYRTAPYSCARSARARAHAVSHELRSRLLLTHQRPSKTSEHAASTTDSVGSYSNSFVTRTSVLRLACLGMGSHPAGMAQWHAGKLKAAAVKHPHCPRLLAKHFVDVAAWPASIPVSV